MTNWEFYKEDVKNMMRAGCAFDEIGFDIDTGQVMACADIGDNCESCSFCESENCFDRFVKWLGEEYCVPKARFFEE